MHSFTDRSVQLFVMRNLLKLFYLIVPFADYAQQAPKTLDYFLQNAIQNSPLFIENKNQAESLKYDSLYIRALYRPQVNFDNNNVYAPVVNGIGYDNAISNGGMVSALVGANVALVGHENLSTRFQSLWLQGKLLQVMGKLSERDLRQNITAQYIVVYGGQEMLRNAEEVLKILSNEDAVLKKLAAQGVYRETDYLSFLVTYKQQELACRQKKLQVKNDLALLNYACGISDTAYTDLEKPVLGKKNALAPEQTLAFRQYTVDSLILRNKYDLVSFDYRPRLNAFGDAGYLSSFAYRPENNFGMSAGLHLVVPIYDGKQRTLRYEKIRLSENTRVSYMTYYRKQYSQKVLQLQQQAAGTEQLVSEAQKQLSISDALVQANRKLLAAGDVKMVDYVLSFTNYIAAQTTVLQLYMNEMQLINEFNYLNYQ